MEELRSAPKYLCSVSPDTPMLPLLQGLPVPLLPMWQQQDSSGRGDRHASTGKCVTPALLVSNQSHRCLCASGQQVMAFFFSLCATQLQIFKYQVSSNRSVELNGICIAIRFVSSLLLLKGCHLLQARRHAESSLSQKPSSGCPKLSGHNVSVLLKADNDLWVRLGSGLRSVRFNCPALLCKCCRGHSSPGTLAPADERGLES